MFRIGSGLELVAFAATRVGLAACGAAVVGYDHGEQRWPLLARVLQWTGVLLDGSLVLQIFKRRLQHAGCVCGGGAISKLIGGYHASAVVCIA
jgi:hypothetical protein